MRPSVIMLAVIAFVLAGAAAFLVKVFLERQSQPVVVQQEEKPKGIAKVLVASRTINPGEILEAKDVTWAEWPKALVEDRMIDESEFVVPSETVPPTQVGLIVRPEASDAGAATASGDEKNAGNEVGEQKVATSSGSADNEIVGAVARRRILANEPISPDQLIQRGDHSIGSAVVSPGMRAVSVAISAQTASGGFIAPGDYVDVMLSISHDITVYDETGKKAPEGTPALLPDGDTLVKFSTETVMRNVKVLAIDQSLGRNAEEGPADVGKTATLEVSPHDAEKLLTATQLGSLTLVLRSMVVDGNAQDEIDAFEDPFNFTSDVATSRAVSALRTTASLYGFRGNSAVRVNRGGSISQEGF